MAEEERPTFNLGFENALSDLSDDEIDQRIKDMHPKKTKQQTNWGVSKFLAWVDRRPSITIDFESVEEEELASVLKKFYLEVRKKTFDTYHVSLLALGYHSFLHDATEGKKKFIAKSQCMLASN